MTEKPPHSRNRPPPSGRFYFWSLNGHFPHDARLRRQRNARRRGRPARHLMTEAEALATDPTAELIPGTVEARHVIEHGHACIAPRRVESPQAGAVAAHQARAGCERDDRA